MTTARRVLVLNENESVPHDRRVWQVCSALRRHGWDVVVVSPQGEGSESQPFERLDGIEVHRYRPRFASGGAVGYAVEYGWAVLQTWRLVRHLADRGFDVVHACNPPDVLLLSALPLKRRGTRFVFDHHDLVPELYLSRFGRGPDLLYRFTRAGERLAFRLADVVLATNDSYRDVALGRGKKRPEDVFVVRNAPDLSVFQRGQPDVSLRRGRPHLLAYVGVMGPQDGVDYALRALSLLRGRRDDWHAVFVGDGDVLGEMRRLADRLGLADRVEFPGWSQDDYIVRVLSTADVALAPDPTSPLNDVSTMVKVAEYMAMSCPVVSFDLREARASAADAAVYAPPNDEAQFAARIDELLSDPGRRAAMGARGRARVEQALSWEASERSLLAAYERALARA